jgi:hypothetical protein
MSQSKHTPGPFFVRQPDVWPFDIEVVGPDGDVAWSERRVAHSARQKNLTDCMFAVGFDHDRRPGIIASLERQLADIYVRAAAPDLLEALSELLAHTSFMGIASHYDDMARAAIAKAEGRTPLNAEGGDK